MKKTLRTLFAVLALTLCLCLPAFAQEAKPAQPAAKEDKTVTDLTGPGCLSAGRKRLYHQLWRALCL